MADIAKIRIKDYTGEHIYHPETEADIVIRGNSNVDADLQALETAVENIAVYSLTRDQEAADGYAATYHLTKDGVNEGVAINIPKDFVVNHVTVKVCDTPDVPVEGLQPGDKYIDFEINVVGESGESGEDVEHIYLAVSDLFVPYTAGKGISIEGTTIAVDESVIPNKEELATLLSEKQDTLVSGSNIVTINGNDLLESGNLDILTYQPFPSDWPKANDSFLNLLSVVAEDTSATKGMAYLDEVANSITGLPFTGNAELQIDIMSGTEDPTTKVVHAVITSGNVPPYRWEYTAWGYDLQNHEFVWKSGWIGYQPELTAGTGIDITNNVISANLSYEVVDEESKSL